MEVAHIRVPLDLEWSFEMRRLVASIAKRLTQSQDPGADASRCAWLLVVHLYSELARAARQTDAVPGVLNAASTALVRERLESVWPAVDGVTVGWAALTESGWLTPRPFLRTDGEGEWQCDRFVRDNPQYLPGADVPQHLRAAAASAVVRKQRVAARETAQLALTIAPECFLSADGQPMEVAVQDRAVRLIQVLDNMLGGRQRSASDYTPGLVAQAGRVVTGATEDGVRRQLSTLASRRTHPRLLGATTESVLRDWDGLAGLR